MRIWCCEFDLARPETLDSVVPHSGEPLVRALVRLHGDPVGYVQLPHASATPAALTELARRELGDRLAAHPASTGSAACRAELHGQGRVSVVVCTRNRSAMLRDCLRRLARVDYPDVEFLIVDNAPRDGSTEAVVAAFADGDPRFRYAREPRPGLSRARNAGLALATGRYVAYTDDDVSVDPGWVHGLVRGFRRRPDVACVTGPVCTATISNEAEAYFDARNSQWWTRCDPHIFDLASGPEQGALYPFAAGVFGTGASFAFDRERLRELGGFDEALGAGTATKGGEDLDAFVRVLLSGGAIAYDPAALVWHHHRADRESLLEQMFGYGTGLTAYLTKQLLQPSTRVKVLARIPRGVLGVARIPFTTNRRLHTGHSAPRGAFRRELAGFAAGPFLYAKARRAI